MSSRAGIWKRYWRKLKRALNRRDEFAPESGDPELREIFVRTALRVAAAFAIIFGLVFFAFWWSGAAVGFGASRAAGKAPATWAVTGTVRDAVTHDPVPWATVEDDPIGRPPLFRTDAGYSGVYELVTLPEPHRLKISSPGYESATVPIGRAWFLWMPRGGEKQDIYLQRKP
jgi:hypothetical protein